ncbi:MAG: tetratricopeptide repeat protein [Planctomycetes bacterium]|nr:tetratricopeptide repeat protein [Planctomycetota bacterium]
MRRPVRRSIVGMLVLVLSGCVTEVTKETYSSPDAFSEKDGNSILDSEIERAETLARQYPDRPDYREHLAKLLFRSERIDDALDEIEEAIEKDPKNPRFHYTLGTFYYRMGKYDLAEGAMRKMVEFTPAGRYTGPHQALGFILALRGKIDEAIAEYRTCLAIDGDFAEAYYFLGSLYDMKEDPDRTIAYYEKYLAFEGGRYRKAAEKRLSQLRRSAAPVPASAHPERLP